MHLEFSPKDHRWSLSLGSILLPGFSLFLRQMAIILGSWFCLPQPFFIWWSFLLTHPSFSKGQMQRGLEGWPRIPSVTCYIPTLQLPCLRKPATVQLFASSPALNTAGTAGLYSCHLTHLVLLSNAPWGILSKYTSPGTSLVFPELGSSIPTVVERFCQKGLSPSRRNGSPDHCTWLLVLLSSFILQSSKFESSNYSFISTNATLFP